MTLEELETSALVNDSSVHFVVSRLEVTPQHTIVCTMGRCARRAHHQGGYNAR